MPARVRSDLAQDLSDGVHVPAVTTFVEDVVGRASRANAVFAAVRDTCAVMRRGRLADALDFATVAPEQRVSHHQGRYFITSRTRPTNSRFAHCCTDT